MFLAISGCASTDTSQQSYPAELVGIKQSPYYPLEAAGFSRGKIFMYAPDMEDVSIGYNMFNSENQIASTIYIYEFSVTLKELFLAEKSNIISKHSGAALLKESEIKIARHGSEYKALAAEFEFDADFDHSLQPVFSQLILWTYNDKFIKLRSTSPISQRSETIEKNMVLINVVNWTETP